MCYTNIILILLDKYCKMEPCMPNCPANGSEHCDVLCPTNSTCNGAPNTHGEHECLVCCCFPINMLAYIVTTPCCMCNMCCSISFKSNTVVTEPPKLSLPYETSTNTSEEPWGVDLSYTPTLLRESITRTSLSGTERRECTSNWDSAEHIVLERQPQTEPID